MSEDSSGLHAKDAEPTTDHAEKSSDTVAEQGGQERADQLKNDGNVLFGQGEYEAARDKYWEALGAAPPASPACAVYFCNIAACDLKLKQYDMAIQHATSSLDADPERRDGVYKKALMRRAMAFEALDDLEHALKDAQAVAAADASDSWAQAFVVRLEPQVKERHETMKTEMIGKLKDLGNTILGNFGLSIDNFKAVQDPNTGSYSISFQK